MQNPCLYNEQLLKYKMETSMNTTTTTTTTNPAGHPLMLVWEERLSARGVVGYSFLVLNQECEGSWVLKQRVSHTVV